METENSKSANIRDFGLLHFYNREFVVLSKEKNEKHNYFTGISDACGYRLRAES